MTLEVVSRPLKKLLWECKLLSGIVNNHEIFFLYFREAQLLSKCFKASLNHLISEYIFRLENELYGCNMTIFLSKQTK